MVIDLKTGAEMETEMDVNTKCNIYEAISNANAEEIRDILEHVLFCYGELFPQWSVSVLSVDKKEDKIKQIDETIALLNTLKENPHLLGPRLIKI